MQQNLRIWLGTKDFVRCMYKSRWKMPYHIHYLWSGNRQRYIGQKATHCTNEKCSTQKWLYRQCISIERLIDELIKKTN